MRPPREDEEGAIHHVYAHACHREELFVTDDERRTYVAMLGITTAECGWRTMSYCLMGNHVHLLIEAPKGNLAVGMKWLHGTYARECNRRRGRVGHLFRDRYGATRIRTDEQLVTAATYIAANPVAAGMCEAPEEWPWTAPGPGTPGWIATQRLLKFFESFGGDGAERYREVLASRLLSGSGA